MKDKKWDLDNCEDTKHISNKLYTKNFFYKKVKQDSISIFQSQIYCNQFKLLESHITAQAMQKTIRKKYDIYYSSKIGTIRAKVTSKLFIEFTNIDNYYQVYLETYDKIASQLANKNGHEQQARYYKVFLQNAILDKLPEFYTLFISAINKKWLEYISVNLCDIIHYITQYLKADPLKILYTRLNASNLIHLNKK